MLLKKMKWSDLYKSLFSILSIENQRAKVVGTGFVINKNPIYILSCYHVVSEGIENNDGKIKYSITKRSGKSLKEFDIRRGEISYLRAKKVFHRPEFDLSILEIDPGENEDIAKKLNLHHVKALNCNFKEKARKIGTSVVWLSTGVLGDLILTPRFFKGDMITGYTTNQKYKFKDSHGQEQEQEMEGIRLLEINQLFVPDCSGGPVVGSKNGKVIGYIHGFKSWPIMTNSIIEHGAQITENNNVRNVKIRSQAPLLTSFSLAIDICSVEKLLKKEKFIRN